MNRKAKGTRNEHRSIRILEAEGYQCTRAAASLGVWDVIGVGAEDVVLVQVKSNEWPRAAEMAALWSFRCPKGARRVIHRWRDRQSVPDVKEI
jgi:hypothetical protein